jgi:hypothetical protein
VKAKRPTEMGLVECAKKGEKAGKKDGKIKGSVEIAYKSLIFI